MAFDVRTWDVISAETLAWIQGHPSLPEGVLPSDFRVGALETAHIEAVAVAMEELYGRFALAIPEAIQESCFQAFGFTPLPALPATASVVFSSYTAASGTVTIPSGTLVMSASGVRFRTTAAGTIAIAQTQSGAVPVLAEDAGVVGNVPAGSLTILPYPIAGVDLVTNAAAALGGAEAETQAARVLRFQKALAAVVRGTAGAIEFAASQVPGVAAARVVEPWDLPSPPAGVSSGFWLWADGGSGDGSVPSGLLPGLRSALSDFKAAGVRGVIRGVTYQPVLVEGAVQVRPGSESRFAAISAALTSALSAVYAAATIGGAISYQDMYRALVDADDDVVGVTLRYWFLEGSRPSLPSTADLAIQDPGLPDTTGRRLTLAVGAYSAGGAPVSFPSWSLA